MGVELFEPITTPASQALNLSNEGGYDYRYRYLKNIMGLWIVQNIRKELGADKYGFAQLSEMANEAAALPPSSTAMTPLSWRPRA